MMFEFFSTGSWEGRSMYLGSIRTACKPSSLGGEVSVRANGAQKDAVPIAKLSQKARDEHDFEAGDMLNNPIQKGEIVCLGIGRS